MFHNHLKAQRLKCGFSQKQVADYLSVSPQSISKWEKGDALPSIDFLPKLAKYLGCDINTFFVKEEKSAADYGLFHSFFALMADIIYNEAEKTDDVAAFVLENPGVMDAVTALCMDLKEYKTVNVRTIRGMLDCNEEEARAFIRHLEQCEMVENLDVADSYFVIKDSVDGFIALLSVEKTLCKILNKRNETKPKGSGIV